MNESREYLLGRVSALEAINGVLMDIIKIQLTAGGSVDAWLRIGRIINDLIAANPTFAGTEFGIGFSDTVAEFAEKFVDK